MPEDLDRIVPLQPAGTRVPLYCVHAVSGSAYSYAGLARLLGDDQPVYGFEAPGFDNARDPVRSLSKLAAEYTAILRAARPAGPYRLLGWSLGGVLAYDMAARLSAAGATVSDLILVDSGLPYPAPLPAEREILHRFVRDMMGVSDASPPRLADFFAAWPERAEPRRVFAAVHRCGLLPEDLDEELLNDQYRVFRAHLEAFFAGEALPAYAGRIVHIRAEQSLAGEMRWDTLAPQLVEHTMPGTHHSIWAGAGLPHLSGLIGRSLTRQEETRVHEHHRS